MGLRARTGHALTALGWRGTIPETLTAWQDGAMCHMAPADLEAAITALRMMEGPPTHAYVTVQALSTEAGAGLPGRRSLGVRLTPALGGRGALTLTRGRQ